MGLPEKSTDPWASWEPCEEQRAAAVLARLAEALPAFFADSIVLECRSLTLSFYDDHQLVELGFVRDHGTERAFVLDGLGTTVWLSGDSGPIHETNENESLVLTDETVADYVRFFFYFLRADSGAFVLTEDSSEIGPDDDTDVDSTEAGTALTLAEARGQTRPLTARGRDDGRWLFDATIAYGDALFTSSIAVGPDGQVEMLDDEPIGTLDGLVVSQPPALTLQIQADHLAAEPPDTRYRSEGPLDDAVQPDREVTQAVVAALLEDALRERNSDTKPGSVLLRHFNSQTHADRPIEQLTRLMSESTAMVLIESDIPFVEDFVARLAAAPDVGHGDVVRAGPVSGDDLRCEIAVNNHSKLYLLSFQTYRGLFDAERVANDLALSDASVLIGCNRAGEVPEPLRRMADLVLSFPRIDRQRFARIFERVFGVKPVAGWEGEGSDWTRFLVPADFHAPRRLGLSAAEALTLLRDRVAARLHAVTPDVGPRLDELHGLGEARQVAEDLIEDIRAAQDGEIPWTAVDRGLMLVGAPGTGKTTLARAIAKECGVKFVVASAANWQSSGYLDAHLRAMRNDFAEARRYAPAILFIDEVDSVGSRERIQGPSVQYQTEVINALLAEIQGIDSTESVIVIAATNYLDNVDPALRRAGRLDQVVEIPLPNIEGLERIYGYYLDLFASGGGELGSDVDVRGLAELTFGLSAADVEFFVRGGARRARRNRRPLGQEDLLAEVTRRPRHPDSAPRLTPAEMRRVAIHEAGHAVARLTSATKGADLTFVTITPRLDGSLGFTAAVPADTRVLTRRSMLEQLETVLAGRAAEEVIFGPDDISAGAGGQSSGSDLAVATRLATLLVCQSGLSDDSLLRWTTQPTADQDEKIDQVLRDAYRNTRSRLQACRALLEQVAKTLQDKQEVSGKELRELLQEIGPQP